MGAFSVNNNYTKTNGSLRLFYNFGVHDISDGFHSDDNNYGWIFNQSLNLFKGNTITLGFDGKTYGGKARQEQNIIGDTTVWEIAGYVFVQQNILEKLTINGGYRLEHHNVYGNEPVPSAGAAWRPLKTTTIKASISKGFRSPTIRELYLFPPANEDLKPEKVVNTEIGILQQLFKNSLQVELTIFKAEGSNLIKTLVNSGRPLNVNTGTFSNTGVELSTKWRISENLSFSGNYSYISMKHPVIATPEIQANSSLLYRKNKLMATLSMQNIHNLYLQTGATQITENYTILNTKISYKILPALSMFVKLENILDRKYYINYGYPMPGILAFCGINFQLN
ncbi:MAG: TonB-dependent receptor [Bacteroidetes bacterium]|nr:TonB-dependent receptor [Bacteroidota bacterium]